MLITKPYGTDKQKKGLKICINQNVMCHGMCQKYCNAQEMEPYFNIHLKPKAEVAYMSSGHIS